jgi:hypothetical protein
MNSRINGEKRQKKTGTSDCQLLKVVSSITIMYKLGKKFTQYILVGRTQNSYQCF